MRIKPWFSPHGTPGRTPVCTPSPPPTRSSPIALRMRYNPAPQPRRAPAQRRRAGCMDALAQTLRAWDADAPLPLLALQTYARGWHLIPPSHALTPICRRRVHPHPRPCDNGDANRSIRHASFLLCADSNAAGATKPMCKHRAWLRWTSPLPAPVIGALGALAGDSIPRPPTRRRYRAHQNRRRQMHRADEGGSLPRRAVRRACECPDDAVRNNCCAHRATTAVIGSYC